jgi:hypothetical protein
MPPKNKQKTQRLLCQTCKQFTTHFKRLTNTGGFWRCIDCEKREMAEQTARERKQ